MRELPDPGFAGDDGLVAPEVSAALAAYAVAPDRSHGRTLAVLQHARLLVPVVALLGEVGYDDQGRPLDKTSDMASVLMRGQDGRTALLAFTEIAALRRWDPEARPVPVSARTAATAAIQDGASAVVVDVAGPVLFVVEGDDLAELAAGSVLVRVSAVDGARDGARDGAGHGAGYGWARPGP